MCGIAGFVGEGSREVVERMARALIHRGPDSEGYFFVPGVVGFGFRRLAIIDLTTGQQPVFNEDRSVAAMLNGEIYNFAELKRELETRHSFRSSGDTEVLAHLYEEAGEGMLARLNGMFAFALWDAKARKLFLARDRLGKKPLYWTRVGNTLMFGSELKALLVHPLVQRGLDPDAVLSFLAYEYVPSPRTIFKGIHKLEPAHCLVFEKGRVTIRRYWDLPFGQANSPAISESEAMERLEAELDRAVKLRLVSDVPLGVFLSGGLDSSTITYFAERHSSRPLKSFSVGFADKEFDEAPLAKRVAARLKTEHYEYRFSLRDFLESIPEIFRKLDEPLADASLIPTYLLSGFARQHVTVAVGGDGGDELFLGYPTFIAQRLSRWYRRLPLLVRRSVIEPLVRSLPPSFGDLSIDFRLKKFIQGTERPLWLQNQIWLGAFRADELQNLVPALGGTMGEDSVYDSTRLLFERVSRAPPLQALDYLYFKQYLADQILVKVDRASMLHGLEVRAPFLDFKLVEWVVTLPQSVRFRNLHTKYLLKKLMAPKLGADIAYRKKKGFSLPVGRWLRGPGRPLLLDTLSRQRLGEVGFFNPAAVERLIHEHLGGKEDHRKKLWTLMVFMWWYGNWYRSRGS